MEEAYYNTIGLYLYVKQEPLHRGDKFLYEMALFYSGWQWH